MSVSSVQVVVEVAVAEAKRLPLGSKSKAPGAEPPKALCVPYFSLFRFAAWGLPFLPRPLYAAVL